MMPTLVSDHLQLGDAVSAGAVTIVPIYPRRGPAAEYLTYERAAPLGVRIAELHADGVVPELRAENPTDSYVLLYDGEELTGAKQNRILNLTVLLAPRSTAVIPVSCVEQGRWSSRSEAFSPAMQTAAPAVRRRKATRLAGDPLARGAAQGEVWAAVSDEMAMHVVASPTAAQSDVFDAHRVRLDELALSFPLLPGQSGALLACGGAVVCLDYVSRPDAFADLYPKLLVGYLLEARRARPAPNAATGAVAERFLATLDEAKASERPSVAVGRDLRLDGAGQVGSGLTVEGELVQLSAFAAATAESSAPHSRIAPPSRRG
jgi:hypothetical protein